MLVVFEEQRARLRSFFVRGVGADAPADDFLQETLFRAWDHRASLAATAPATEREVRDGARRYLWRVARNLMTDEIRARRRASRRRAAQDSAVAAADHAGGLAAQTPAEDVEREDCLRVIRETVGHLPNERVRTCLDLWLDGFDPRGIARRLGLRTGQVRGLLQRGRAEVIRRAGVSLRARRPG